MKIPCPSWIRFSVKAILWFHLWFTVKNWSLVWFLHPTKRITEVPPTSVPVLAESLQNCWPIGPGGTSHVLVTGKRRWLVNALYFVTALCLTCGVTLGPLEASSGRWFSLGEVAPGDRNELLIECTLLYHSDSPVVSPRAPCGSCR